MEETQYTKLLLETFSNVDVQKADEIKDKAYTRIMDIYGGKVNTEIIEFLETYASSLYNAGHFDKAINQYNEVIDLQKEYKGEESLKFKQLRTTVTTIRGAQLKVRF